MKYGTAWKKVLAGRIASSSPLRRQPTRIPISVPRTKETAVATLIRPSVQGRSVEMSVVTGTLLAVEVPRFPCSNCPR